MSKKSRLTTCQDGLHDSEHSPVRQAKGFDQHALAACRRVDEKGLLRTGLRNVAWQRVHLRESEGTSWFPQTDSWAGMMLGLYAESRVGLDAVY